jgi:hypothetical protein
LMSHEPSATSHGLSVGEPVPCRCGRDMTVRFSEAIRSGFGAAQRPAGDRYMYVCPGCNRRLDVRWLERDCKGIGHSAQGRASEP